MADIPQHLIGLYSPIHQGTELEHLQDAVARYSRVLMVSMKLAEMYHQRARECDELAASWDRQAAETGGLLALALRRKWALEGADNGHG